jgi:hypothetical protein
VGDIVISRVKCFITGTTLLFGALSAFANSTAFNGYVQSNGNTGIDLSSIDGGNYRVTVTRGGQLNFRYAVGGQVFDSNPDVAVFDMISNSDAYTNPGSALPAYAGFGPTAQDPVLGGSLSSYTADIGLARTSDQSQLSGSGDLDGVHAQSGSVTSADALTGSNFYVPPQQGPESFQVPNNSLVTLVASNNSSSYFYTNESPFFSVEEVPEPTTLALIAGALLAGIAIRRRLVAPA